MKSKPFCVLVNGVIMDVENQPISTKSIFYPPGGILIWFLIILEIFAFLGGIFAFLSYRSDELEEFVKGRNMLNPLLGTINTIVLISSGYFIANAVHQLRSNDTKSSSSSTLKSLLLGILFLGIKSTEYYLKLSHGIGMDYSMFFSFYWMLTGFHFVHVLFGVGLLIYARIAIKKNTYSSKNMLDVESIATYWHLCDLIWILIFPILYLV